MEIKELYSHFIASKGAVIDSRSIQSSQIFFGIKGETFDGNKFAETAIESGAKLAVVDDPSLKDKKGMYYVNNVLDALQNLAKYHRSQLKCQIIAITGSNGKTTTKELLKAVLETQFSVQATEGNLNNHLGVPLTILKTKPETEILIVEMGANHIGEISNLCEIADPDYGIITNIGKAHLEGFGSLEGVIKAKSELFHFMCKKNGTIFYNLEEKNIDPKIFSNCIHKSFSHKDFEIVAEFPYLHCTYNNQLVITQMYGRYNLANVALSFTVGNHFGINVYNVLKGIESYKPQNNRSQFVKIGTNSIILDAYNANPSSMTTAIMDFSLVNHPKKITILGDMLELGKYSEAEHKAILTMVNEKSFYQSIFIGSIFYQFRDQFSFDFYENIEAALKAISINDFENSLILLKGSRKISLEKFTL
ncbi:MAG: UDP-N-acetylmuramoyl-tripeptide--D-alanyl-D-alanine ligase [Saprospiraceae bacterium]